MEHSVADGAQDDMGGTYSIELGPHKNFGYPTIFTTPAGSTQIVSEIL